MEKKSIIILSIASVLTIVVVIVLTLLLSIYIPQYRAEKAKAQEFVNLCIDATNHYDKGLYALAESEYLKALEIDNTSWFAEYLLGICYYQEKKYSQALPHFESAYQFNESKSDFNLLGLNSMEHHILDTVAHDHICHFIKLLDYAAWSCSYMEAYDKGIVYAQEEYYLDSYSGAPDVLALLYAKKKDYSQAIKWAELMEGSLRDDKYNFRMGWIYSKMNNDTKALEYYEKDINNRPQNAAGSYRNAAWIYDHKGHYYIANQYMKEAAKLGSKQAQDYLLKKGLNW